MRACTTQAGQKESTTFCSSCASAYVKRERAAIRGEKLNYKSVAKEI